MHKNPKITTIMTKKDKAKKQAQGKLPFTPLKPLGKIRFQKEEWHVGDTVRLTNGKTYKVVRVDALHSRLDLRSEEYHTDFRADCRIIHEKIRE